VSLKGWSHGLQLFSNSEDASSERCSSGGH
jgi:hypothetical protein